MQNFNPVATLLEACIHYNQRESDALTHEEKSTHATNSV